MDMGLMCRTVCLFTPPAYAGIKLNCLVAEAMCLNDLPTVAIDSAAAGI